MKIIGCVFDSGFAFANTENDVQNLLDCTENTEMREFPNEASAYMWMIKTYENRGIAKSCLLPAPRFEDLMVSRFFSTEDPEIIRERNKHKSRYFALWSMEIYGIYTKTDYLTEDFFLPNMLFLLKEASSADEAVKIIFEMYASRVFPLYPYSGGVPIPMLGKQFDMNNIIRTQYINYILTNCKLPEQLKGMDPLNDVPYLSNLCYISYSEPVESPDPADDINDPKKNQQKNNENNKRGENNGRDEGNTRRPDLR